MDEIRILPPRPGGCKICGARHRPEEPHEYSSLYYKVKFYGSYRRFPTREDAAAHCPDAVRAAYLGQKK